MLRLFFSASDLPGSWRPHCAPSSRWRLPERRRFLPPNRVTRGMCGHDDTRPFDFAFQRGRVYRMVADVAWSARAATYRGDASRRKQCAGRQLGTEQSPELFAAFWKHHGCPALLLSSSHMAKHRMWTWNLSRPGLLPS
jgi:hypothetical protein